MTRAEFEALQVGDRVSSKRSESEYEVASTSVYFGEPTVSFKSIHNGWGDEYIMTLSADEFDIYGAYRKLEDGDA